MSKELKLIYGDVQFFNGDPVLSGGQDKLAQDVGKIIVTQLGGPYFPNYGCNLYDLIGRYQTSAIQETVFRKAILDALNYYQKIQYQQSFMQTLTPDEIMVKIENVSVSKGGPSSYLINVSVINGQGTNVPVVVPT